MTVTAVEVRFFPAALDDDINHVTCPDSDCTISLCGHDVSTHRIIGDDEEITCQVCIDLQSPSGMCEPGVTFCPLNGICREDDDV